MFLRRVTTAAHSIDWSPHGWFALARCLFVVQSRMRPRFFSRCRSFWPPMWASRWRCRAGRGLRVSACAPPAISRVLGALIGVASASPSPMPSAPDSTGRIAPIERSSFPACFTLIVLPYLGTRPRRQRTASGWNPRAWSACSGRPGPSAAQDSRHRVIIDGRIADVCETGSSSTARWSSPISCEGRAAGCRFGRFDEAEPRPPRPRHPAEDPEDVGVEVSISDRSIFPKLR